jgi:superkiller protein 3
MVSMNDDNALAYKNLGTALSLDGDLAHAEPALRRALELEPNSLAYDTLGLLLYSRGKYSEAATMFEKAIGLRPRHHLLHSHLADALQAAGRTDAARTAYLEARDLAADALRINPRDAFVKMDLAWISAALGDFTRADTLIRGALNSAPDDPFTHYISALISSRQGTNEQAFASLERAVDLGYTTALLEHDPILADLQSDPRWQSLVENGH